MDPEQLKAMAPQLGGMDASQIKMMSQMMAGMNWMQVTTIVSAVEKGVG